METFSIDILFILWQFFHGKAAVQSYLSVPVIVDPGLLDAS